MCSKGGVVNKCNNYTEYLSYRFRVVLRLKSDIRRKLLKIIYINEIVDEYQCENSVWRWQEVSEGGTRADGEKCGIIEFFLVDRCPHLKVVIYVEECRT